MIHPHQNQTILQKYTHRAQFLSIRESKNKIWIAALK